MSYLSVFRFIPRFHLQSSIRAAIAKLSGKPLMNAQILYFPIKKPAIDRLEVISCSQLLDAAWDAAMEAAQVFVETNGDLLEEGGAYVVVEDPETPFVRLLKIKGVGEVLPSGEWKVLLLRGLPYTSQCVYEAGCNAFVEELKLADVAARVLCFQADNNTPSGGDE